MAKMYSKGRGKAKSIRPYDTCRPTWVTQTDAEIEAKIVELAKKGLPESLIGNFLRDEMGIPSIKTILHCSLSKVLERNDVKPAIPDGLMGLMKKCKNMRDHFNKNKKDKTAKFHLSNNESKIYRQMRWLKKVGKIDQGFAYDKHSDVAN